MAAKTRQAFRWFRAAICSLLVLLFCPSNSDAEIKIGLNDPYLQGQADWGVYLDVQEIQQYLNYPKSKLHPLSRVRATYREFSRTKAGASQAPKTHEILWYFQRTPIGMKRYTQLSLRPQTMGMVVLGPTGGSSEHCADLTNTLIRTLIEIQFTEATVSNVLVPGENYDEIANQLHYYHFSKGMNRKEGKQMNIHLCSSTSAREDFFFLDN
jgi:hypothetical protein